MDGKRTVLFGAGQMGRWLCGLLPEFRYRPVAFLDNRPPPGGEVLGLPVAAPSALGSFDWDVIIVAMTGADRQAAALSQLAGLGVPPERVETAPAFAQALDPRLPLARSVARQMDARGMEGAVAELGVYRGEYAALLNACFPRRRLYLFDTFTGFAPEDVAEEAAAGYSGAAAGDFADTSVELVRGRLPHPEQAVFRAGMFPGTAAGLEETFCFVSIDADLYRPVYEGLRYFYPRLCPGGAAVVHDCGGGRFAGAGAAVEQFCEETGALYWPLGDMHGSAVLTKQQEA